MQAAVVERFQQLYILLKKDFKLAIRSWKTSAVQIFAPLLFLLVLLLIQEIPHNAYYANGDPPAHSIGHIPACYALDEPYCYSLMYAPNNDTFINSVVQYMAEESGLTVEMFTNDTSTMTSKSIIGCESEDQIVNFLWGHQNVTQAAIIFYLERSQYPSGSGPPSGNDEYTFAYNVMYNGSCLSAVVPLGTQCPNIRYAAQRSVDNAFLKATTNNGSQLTVTRKPYPIVSLNTALNDTVSTYGILFFYCGMMFCFVIIIYQLVNEKERKLKQGMKLMGLKSSAFWTSWFIYGTVMTFLEAIVMMIGGYICYFTFFWETNFMVNFLVFFLFGEAMLTLAFWVSTMISTSKSAISVGMLLFIVGVLLQMLLSSESLLIFAFYDHYWVSTLIYYILVWYPPFNFAKCIEDITSKSFNYGEYQGPGYSWDDLYLTTQTTSELTLPATVQSLYLLMVNIVIFAILTWYFENVLPGESGSLRPPWFFLTKEYWGVPRVIPPKFSSNKLERADENADDIDEDVVREDDNARNDTGNQSAVRCYRLSKRYRKIPFISTKWDVHAQDNVSFTIAEGSLFCLLGHNGAGKTTTINILTGLFPPTEGDAFIYGKSILTEMNEIRASMGVCPQHDILWDEMSAVEHLDLYARLKRIPAHERANMIATKLEMVRLTSVGNNRVGSYSGGMKRRLSVAISSIGEPNIIFMDEPTTGMDPMSRRHVWELINEMKKNRVIVLTTHSMEEADVLADRMAIMAHGKIRCVGNSLHLKNKFGDGYRINIATNQHQTEKVKKVVYEYIPSATLIAENGGSLVFGFSTDKYQQLVPFFRYLEQEEKAVNSCIIDWGISQTSLEDVFLKVTRQVYSGGNRIDGVQPVA